MSTKSPTAFPFLSTVVDRDGVDRFKVVGWDSEHLLVVPARSWPVRLSIFRPDDVRPPSRVHYKDVVLEDDTAADFVLAAQQFQLHLLGNGSGDIFNVVTACCTALPANLLNFTDLALGEWEFTELAPEHLRKHLAPMAELLAVNVCVRRRPTFEEVSPILAQWKTVAAIRHAKPLTAPQIGALTRAPQAIA